MAASPEVPEACYEEEVTSEEESLSVKGESVDGGNDGNGGNLNGENMNGWNGNDIEYFDMEIQRLKFQLHMAQQAIAQKDTIILQKNDQLATTIFLFSRLSQIAILGMGSEKLNKSLAQEISKLLDYDEAFAMLKEAEQHNNVRDKETVEKTVVEEYTRNFLEENLENITQTVGNRFEEKEGEQLMTLKTKVQEMNQELLALKQKIELQNLVLCTSPPAETTAMPVPTTNEELDDLPSQPVENGDTVELGEMSQKLDNVPDPENNGDFSGASFSPQPGPSYSLISDDDDAEEGRSAMSLEEPTGEQQYIERDDMGESPGKKNVVVHGYDKENLQRGIFACICTKTFKTKQNLQGHVGYYKKARTIPCHVCGKLFSYKSYLKPHLKQAHKIVLDELEQSPRGKMANDARQVVGSGICKQKKKKKHVQDSSIMSDKYACACGSKYATMAGLSNHIAKENK